MIVLFIVKTGKFNKIWNKYMVGTSSNAEGRKHELYPDDGLLKEMFDLVHKVPVAHRPVLTTSSVWLMHQDLACACEDVCGMVRLDR